MKCRLGAGLGLLGEGHVATGAFTQTQKQADEHHQLRPLTVLKAGNGEMWDTYIRYSVYLNFFVWAEWLIQ